MNRRLIQLFQPAPQAPRPCAICEAVHVPGRVFFQDIETGLSLCPACAAGVRLVPYQFESRPEWAP